MGANLSNLLLSSMIRHMFKSVLQAQKEMTAGLPAENHTNCLIESALTKLCVSTSCCSLIFMSASEVWLAQNKRRQWFSSQHAVFSLLKHSQKCYFHGASIL